jgi:hypothetical protein
MKAYRVREIKEHVVKRYRMRESKEARFQDPGKIENE